MRLVFSLWLLASALAIGSVPVTIFPAQDGPSELTLAEQKTIRDSVYKGTMAIGHTFTGPLAFVDMLYVPKDLSEVYSKKKQKTLSLLITIIEGANPHDALLAGALAISLAESPAVGAAICYYPEDRFDELRPNQNVTYRQAIVSLVAKAIGKISDPPK